MIGIVGGVGPYAGLDLTRKVFDQTVASSDQEHLPVALLSLPREIVDRTEYLLGHTATNPAHSIAQVMVQLERLGAVVAGIPCNTAHAPPIFDVIVADLQKAGASIRPLHMIEETASFLRKHYQSITTVGVLCTTGTAKSGVYAAALQKEGVHVIMPAPARQEFVHDAVYSQRTGIKARPNPVTPEAKGILMGAIHELQTQGAQAILLACTEIPLAITERAIGKTIVLDPTLILARALIREANPSKLKPWQAG
ncbi:MAG: aspartate/glutamate racemase family protein [Planctomycetes bacterium]|nr:aspartate/glutamate racemase family protein [Planctomycetota bacterium]